MLGTNKVVAITEPARGIGVKGENQKRLCFGHGCGTPEIIL